ncbi:MAG: signal recognition particle-docking protein FtsY [Cycloclasticus sp.]|nr:signal recognition particle-docking protein FtsY [Cycloclasticus sp.]
MFGFGKKKNALNAEQAPIEESQEGFFGRLKNQLSKTRSGLTGGLGNLFLGKKQIDDELFEELETILLTADVGIDATQHIIDKLTQRVARKNLSDPQAMTAALQEEMLLILEPNQQPLTIPDNDAPFVILVVGVNGMGKTTTIGKLAKRLKADGKSVMLAAGDTFRAAAIEQLQEWGTRNDIEVVAQHTGADSASVIYDAFEKARARKVDVLIADTAGRLHTQVNLMNELSKINRVIKKLDDTAPHEVMLVVDAGTGQNALAQAKHFNEATPLTGITLTKLDGTAKGGIIFAIANQFNLPIRFIGIGEGIDDLREFDARAFTRALFDAPDEAA